MPDTFADWGEESPPFKVPQERVRTLQKAFIDTLKDFY